MNASSKHGPSNSPELQKHHGLNPAPLQAMRADAVNKPRANHEQTTRSNQLTTDADRRPPAPTGGLITPQKVNNSLTVLAIPEYQRPACSCDECGSLKISTLYRTPA